MAKFVSTILIVAILIALTQGQCLEVYESGVGAGDQSVIIDKHNSLRLLLANGLVPGQPRACDIKRLIYDSKLAEAAQKIADTCIFDHVTVNDSRWDWVGQNLYMTMSTGLSGGATWSNGVQSWFDEYKVYTYPNDADLNTGHYTQVVWANTQYVGCGYTSYLSSDATYKYKKLYVCNYGPGGNYGGQAPYQTDANGVCGCENLC